MTLYRKVEKQQAFENFYLPFGGQLESDNRWVKLSKVIPWDVIEDKYADKFAKSGMGAPAKPVRMALGALIIKEKCGFSDEETVQQIRENPYLQFFIGLTEYQKKAPFDSSMMVHFRKRLDPATLSEINELICSSSKDKKKDNNDNNDKGGQTGSGNRGKMILDATCAPSDIRYPTDLSLLNEAREKLEKMIDTLYEPLKGTLAKPRTYRKKARKLYLGVAKTRKPNHKTLRKAVGKQLRFVSRDLKIVDDLISKSDKVNLSQKQIENLNTIRKLYKQQKTMYDNNTHQIDDRIVSIDQPHVRPIVRGKAGKETEFGAKISISLVDGFARVERLSWDNYNEGSDFIEQVEAYRAREGFYPEVVAADKIYRTRENLSFCKEHGIRLSGPKLGRPVKLYSKALKRLQRLDNSFRNRVEGKFGEGKRRYGLARIMAKLKKTSESVIILQFLVMNLEHTLRLLLSFFRWALFTQFFGRNYFVSA
jgi:IS5 family transposase